MSLYLHPFPTRRSSDLEMHLDPIVLLPGLAVLVVVPADEPGRAETGRIHGEVRLDRPRSEEHTSELQSPCKLVCRLLLEKKKMYIYLIQWDLLWFNHNT